jgi:single-strand DNA-binding protein
MHPLKGATMSNGVAITATGNLTRDPELRFSAQGNPWVTFSIAVNEIGRNASGEKTENVTYLNCKMFGEQAENLADSAGKGTRITVEGKLRNEKWKDADGNEKNSYSVYVDEASVSIRWATANVTKKSPNSSGVKVSANSAPADDFASDTTIDSDSNPF